MKSIHINDFVRVGTIIKTHGTQGELRVQTSHKLSKWAFLEIQGKPVPFKIERFQFTQDDEALVKFADINDVEKAASLNGYAVLVNQNKKKKEKKLNDSVVGYTLIDSLLGDIGLVEEMLEMPMQLLLKTTYQQHELLIPAVEAFIEDIDDRKKIIYLNLPEGLVQ
jgi:16S rRNA processing protein RimM